MKRTVRFSQVRYHVIPDLDLMIHPVTANARKKPTASGRRRLKNSRGTMQGCLYRVRYHVIPDPMIHPMTANAPPSPKPLTGDGVKMADSPVVS